MLYRANIEIFVCESVLQKDEGRSDLLFINQHRDTYFGIYISLAIDRSRLTIFSMSTLVACLILKLRENKRENGSLRHCAVMNFTVNWSFQNQSPLSSCCRKYEEVYPPDVHEFVYISRDIFTTREVISSDSYSDGLLVFCDCLHKHLVL